MRAGALVGEGLHQHEGVGLLHAARPLEEDVAGEIVRDNAAGDLAAGIDRLDQAAGGSLAQADDAAAAAAVEGLGNEDELLLAVHAVAVNTLYDDHEVWSILGYEGPSFDKGGYINRGFNDLDWLPDPRIDEYDGPGRVENVPLASNGGN